MRLFPRWHTPESVAHQLISGLESGDLTIAKQLTEAEEMSLEWHRLSTEICEIFTRLNPAYSPPGESPSVEAVEEVARRMPALVQTSIERLRALHADMVLIESKIRSTTHNLGVLRWSIALSTTAVGVFFAYLYRPTPMGVLFTTLAAFATGFVVGRFGDSLLGAPEKNAKLIFDLGRLSNRAGEAMDVCPAHGC